MTKNQFWNDVPRIQKRPFIPTQPVDVRSKSAKSIFLNTVQTAWSMFVDYSHCSTIHGFKYMGERNRTLFERVWWMVVVIISLVVCGHLIANVYQKFNSDPIIVSFSDQETPNWQIPFPAVTICPQSKITPEILNITEMFHLFRRHRDFLYTLDEEVIDQMTAVSQICDPAIFAEIDPKNTTTCSKCVENLRKMAIPFKDMFLLCSYKKNLVKCDTLFDEVITAEGLCYTFNGLNNFRSDNAHDNRWSLEDGYKFDDLLQSYPRRALGAGMQFGFFVVFATCRLDFEFICRGPIQGFKLMLHMPIEYPQIGKHFLRVPVKQETIIIVKPKMMSTSKGVLSFPLESRKCYFFHEKYLRFFRGYTQRNCELECLANFTMKKCGCTKFHLPPVQDVPICGADKIKCYDQAENEILQNQILQKMLQNQSSECNCLPGCTSITYDAEISQSEYDANAFLEALGLNLSNLATVNLTTQASKRITEECVNNLEMARLGIFFKDEQFMAIQRSRMYGSDEFLADCGGLLGLFMGVSFMSILEILYFATVRLYFNLKMGRRQEKIMLSSKSNWMKPIVLQ